MALGSKITQQELIDLFGHEMPIEAAQLLLSPAGGITLKELRSQLKEIAEERNRKKIEAKPTIRIINECHTDDEVLHEVMILADRGLKRINLHWRERYVEAFMSRERLIKTMPQWLPVLFRIIGEKKGIRRKR